MKSIREIANKRSKPISSHNTYSVICLRTKGNNRRYQIQFNKDASRHLNINFMNVNITQSIKNVVTMYLNYIYYKIYKNDQFHANYLLNNLHISDTRSRSFRETKIQTSQYKKYTIDYLKSHDDYAIKTTIRARIKNN